MTAILASAAYLNTGATSLAAANWSDATGAGAGAELIIPDGSATISSDLDISANAIDVLHNFYIPYMSVKMDAVPGIPTRFQFKPTKTTEDMKAILAQNPEWQIIPEGGSEPKWKNFVYEVACAELCGKGHNSMRYMLNVGTEEEHNAWLNQQTAFFDLQKDNLIRWSDEQYAQYEKQFVFGKDDSHHGGDHHDEDHHEDQNHELHAGLKPTQAAASTR